MNCTKCQYVRVSDGNFLFKCKLCDNEHQCGPGTCDSTAYNTDYTNICTLTGMCFEQRMCDSIIDTNRGITNTLDQRYFHRVKRDQQIKNSIIEREFVHEMFDELDFYKELESHKRINLLNKILELWRTFVEQAHNKGVYIHRKDKRCFVVAIMFGLTTGISCSNGYVVEPHSHIKIGKLNKKKSYGKFKVSDIRDGQKLIMRMFDNFQVVEPVKI